MKAIKHSIIVFVFSLIIVSCKKKEEASCGTCPVGGSGEPTGFSYTKNGGSVIYADSASFNSSYKTITAYYQGMSHK